MNDASTERLTGIRLIRHLEAKRKQEAEAKEAAAKAAEAEKTAKADGDPEAAAKARKRRESLEAKIEETHSLVSELLAEIRQALGVEAKPKK